MKLELSELEIRQIESDARGFSITQRMDESFPALLRDRATLLAEVARLRREDEIGREAVRILVENTEFLSDEHAREVAKLQIEKRGGEKA